MTREWQVSVDWTAESAADEERFGDDILDALAPHHAGCVVTPHWQGTWGTTITVEAATLRQATGLGLSLVVAVAGNCGQRGVDPVEVAAQPMDRADDTLDDLRPPVLVSYVEIAELAGVSRQRVRELARQRTFPRPFGTPRIGPVFVKTEVDRWLEARTVSGPSAG